MNAIRSRVRAVAMAWLLCQAASLSAFVPEECCVSHAAIEAKRHHGGHAAEQQEAQKQEEHCHEAVPTQDDCKMSNTCAGPGSQLLRLFALIGVLERPDTPAAVLDSSLADVLAAASPIARLSTPDAPPPKA
jgi:hypothetical protein